MLSTTHTSSTQGSVTNAIKRDKKKKIKRGRLGNLLARFYDPNYGGNPALFCTLIILLYMIQALNLLTLLHFLGFFPCMSLIL